MPGSPPCSSLLPPPPRPRHDSPPPVGRRSSGWIRPLHILGLLIAIPSGLLLGLDGAGLIVAVFVLVVPFDKMFRRHAYRIRRPGLRTDLTYALASPVINVVGLAIGIVVAILAFPIWIPALLLRPFVMSQPGWLMAIEAVILIDILIYWTHRFSHEIGFFWRFHSIHHSSERLDWISAFGLTRSTASSSLSRRCSYWLPDSS